jgi:glycosyltransferase involved in cell wall biosynthesis
MNRFNLSMANQHLMYLGRLHPEKNLKTLIHAMPIILKARPRTHLFIVGFGYEESTLERLAHALSVADHVTFCGLVPDQDLPAAYSACDVFILPSVAELESIVLLQAIASGKPLLVADSGESAATALVRGNGLLFRGREAGHLAAQAIQLLSNPEQLKAMGEESLSMSRRFDIHESIARLESVYASLVRTP